MEHLNDQIRWIPLAPLLAAMINGFWLLFSKRPLPNFAVWALACGAPVLSFFFSVSLFFELSAGDLGFLRDHVYTWISVHPFHAEMSFVVDPLSSIMTLVVTGVGSLIHIYSIGYMSDDHREDRGMQRFFLYLNLFMFSMLMLVLGDNLLVMFVGWEGVGVCSYLLIGFWYLEDHNAMCGQKAFVVNRIGDFGFLLGIFLLFWSFGSAGVYTIEFQTMSQNVGLLANQTVALPEWLGFLPGFPSWKLLTLAGLFLFVGACGKSAQIPLYVWLPDAMAGPTPVSALIHAATMVTAGVYMITRMNFAYAYAPGALATIAWTGGLTALFSALIAICQNDIKKVLAYSTVSQLGYMFLAVGVASYGAAIAHLTTHAFFKALLFMGAGSVILGMHHEQDIRKMGGVARRMPWTHRWFGLGVLAIIGTPLFSGFFSKDQILAGAYLAHDVPGHYVLYGMALFTAVLTAFYMTRLYVLVFQGPSRASVEVERHIEEQPQTILFPLFVLAGLSLVGGLLCVPEGWLGLPIEEWNLIPDFVGRVAAGVPHELSHAAEWGLLVGAVLAWFVGASAAAYVYYFSGPELAARLASRAGVLYRAALEKFYVDEIYAAVIVRPLVFLSDRVLYRTVDARIIDGIGVNGTANLVRDVADRGLKKLQTGLTQSYVFSMVVASALLMAYLIGKP